ncbi:MAG TPA: DUF4390 domain-containing protein [Burkholderiaceae bacterium]
MRGTSWVQVWLTRVACVLASLALVLAPAVQAAEQPELANFEIFNGDDGVLLSYAVNFELPRGVDDALGKAVPLFFVAEAQVFRSRWYWRDLRVAHAVRIWKIVYQPLTSTWRVTFGGLSQSYTSRDEAFAAISRGSRWKVAEAGQIEEGSHHYLEFSYRLDTSLLPRPMQIGVGGQADWSLAVQRTQKIN